MSANPKADIHYAPRNELPAAQRKDLVGGWEIFGDVVACRFAFKLGGSPHHPVFTANGSGGLVVSQTPGTLDVFDIASRTKSASVKVGTMPHWIGLSGGRAFVTNENSGDLSVVDLASNSVMDTLPVGNGPRKIVVQP